MVDTLLKVFTSIDPVARDILIAITGSLVVLVFIRYRMPQVKKQLDRKQDRPPKDDAFMLTSQCFAIRGACLALREEQSCHLEDTINLRFKALDEKSDRNHNELCKLTVEISMVMGELKGLTEILKKNGFPK